VDPSAYVIQRVELAVSEENMRPRLP